MAPERRSRHGRARHARGNGRRPSPQDTISGDSVRRVLDSYCPHCATDIRSAGPRRLTRCPNTALCGKPLPLEECCPHCAHYIRPGDNFCRVCRTNLRGVVRGRGGLYQQINRVPSPNRVSSPPRQQVQPDQDPGEDSDRWEPGFAEFPSDDDQHNTDSDNEEPGNPDFLAHGGGGGFLRIAVLDWCDYFSKVHQVSKSQSCLLSCLTSLNVNSV
ncbi:unnamed protein product, partial [Allacma fusca]